MKKKNKTLGLFVIVTVVVLLLGASSARAMDLRGGDNVVIGANEVINDDVYISANTFTLDGVVKGDLIVFAKNVQINGTVEGDLMAAAQAVNINGALKDDARIAAAVITLGPNAHVADDVLTAGGSIETKPGSTISGGLIHRGFASVVGW